MGNKSGKLQYVSQIMTVSLIIGTQWFWHTKGMLITKISIGFIHFKLAKPCHELWIFMISNEVGLNSIKHGSCSWCWISAANWLAWSSEFNAISTYSSSRHPYSL